MELIDAVVVMIDALEEEHIDYMVVGSLSSNYFGIPRSTHDADLVVQLPLNGIARLRDRLRSILHFDPQTTFESVTGTICTRVIVPETEYKLELFRLGQDPHDQDRFRRRIQVPYLTREVWLPSAEDVVITKLRWAVSQKRRKDTDDVREVLAVQKNALDLKYLHHWTDIHGSRELLEQLMESISNID